MKLKFWKKDKIKTEDDYDNQNLKKLSENKILIKVYKDFGSNTSFLKAKFFAEEKRDQYNNLVSINKDEGYNEDVDFAIDDVYDKMNIILDFKNKPKDQRIALLEKKIAKQNKLVKLLDKWVELNAVYNYADENLKLKDYELLKNYTEKHDGSGSYFTIEDGLRVYSFESVDGFLVPVWRGVDTFSQYPDHTRKKKITVQEDTMHKRENKLITSLTAIIMMNIIVFVILLIAIWQTWDIYQSQDEAINGASRECADNTARLNQQYANMMNLACVQDYVEEIDQKRAEQEAIAEKEQPTDKLTRLIPKG